MTKPTHPDASVHAERDAYLAENGWTLEAYDAKVTEASFFFIDVRVPNTAHHRWAIMRHDLHHVATGYGTDLAGEAEVSAWELRRGLGGLGVYVSSLVLGGALLGLVFEPRRTLRAWRDSGRADDSLHEVAATRSLFRSPESYEALLGGSVGELRARLGVRPEGVSEHPRGRHRRAPASRDRVSRPLATA